MSARRLCLGAILALLSAAAIGGDIGIAFPAERQRLPFTEQTYVIGSVPIGRRAEMLYINGVTTTVHRTGAFIQMVPVTPGTNTLIVCQSGERLIRRFVVAEAKPVSATETEPIAGDEDPRLGEPKAWKTTGTLFANRVRSEIDGGDSIYYLPRDFILRGAEIKGTDWIAVWLEKRRGYLPRKTVVVMNDSVKLPPKGLIAPDPTNGFPDHPPYDRPPSAVRVCVDAGHGGSDSGALSPHGWREKDVNLMQARAIRDALEKAGFLVTMTRDGDSFPSLLGRPQTAYDGRMDAFISVHHNATAAGRDPRVVRHTTTYASTTNGLELAKHIQKHIAQVMAPVPDAGAQFKSLAVCRNPAVPSCLLEVDFINLPAGEEESWNPDRQKRIADAVVCGVLDWMTPEAELVIAPTTQSQQ